MSQRSQMKRVALRTAKHLVPVNMKAADEVIHFELLPQIWDHPMHEIVELVQTQSDPTLGRANRTIVGTVEGAQVDALDAR